MKDEKRPDPGTAHGDDTATTPRRENPGAPMAPEAPKTPGAPMTPEAPETPERSATGTTPGTKKPPVGEAPAPTPAPTPTPTPALRTTGSTAPAYAPAARGGGGTAPTHGTPLLPHEECDKLAQRLHDAVTGFVDGPRAAVEEADRVLEEVASRFADAVTRRRRTLRTAWRSGDEGTHEDTNEGTAAATDTEQLRLALRDYRELTGRLLRM
jgi:hypothetical protein